MISSIIFDVGGVLIENPLPKMLKHYASEFGAQQDKFDKVFFEEFSVWQNGEISEEEFWDRISVKLGKSPPGAHDLWLAGLKSNLTEHKKVIKNAYDLKKKGFKIAILSDTETPVANFLREKYEGFDAYIFSCERGFTKPHREIFEITLKELGVAANEAVFIDDKEVNVVGAEKLGIKAILFENEESLESSLKNILNR